MSRWASPTGRGAPATGRRAPGETGGRRARRSAHPRRHVGRGKLLPRTGWTASSIPAARCWNRWPPTACTTTSAGGRDHRQDRPGLGRECMIDRQRCDSQGGTYYPVTVKKHLRARRSPRRTACRCIIWWTPGGGLPATPGRGLRTATTSAGSSSTRATMSAAGIPQIAAVLGSCTAGGALRAGDERRDGDRPQPGHDLPRRPATRESGHRRDRPGEDLGGDVHARNLRGWSITGPATTATRCASSATSSPPSARARRRPGTSGDLRTRIADQQELYDVVPADARVPYDVREVITRIVDAGEFDEFKAEWQHLGPASPDPRADRPVGK